MLVRRTGEAVPLSGRLGGEELNPDGEEGDLSMIDELTIRAPLASTPISGC